MRSILDYNGQCADCAAYRAELVSYRALPLVPAAEHQAALDRLERALRQVDALTREVANLRDSVRATLTQQALDWLERVLATLSRATGGPDEMRVWNEARAFLVMNGKRAPERDAHQVAYLEWEGRR